MRLSLQNVARGAVACLAMLLLPTWAIAGQWYDCFFHKPTALRKCQGPLSGECGWGYFPTCWRPWPCDPIPCPCDPILPFPDEFPRQIEALPDFPQPDPPMPGASRPSAPKLRNAIDIERNTHSLRRAFQPKVHAQATKPNPAAAGVGEARQASWSAPERARSEARLLIPEDTPR
jgi:hypothetical protein